MSLQFDVRVTVKEYNELTGIRNSDFDYDISMIKEAKEHFEIALTQTPILITGDRVFVATISNISPVV